MRVQLNQLKTPSIKSDNTEKWFLGFVPKIESEDSIKM